MSVYSIKDLEYLSGIKAHTLRIWEQRYDFIKPKRTDTNIRFYDDNDLKLILNVSLLKDNGFKISKISQMPSDVITKEILKLSQSSLSYPDQIHALTLCMIDHDEDRFEKIMSTIILKHGFEETMIKVIYPFLVKIGIMWQTGSVSPSQEHFISNLIRRKLLVAIDGLYISPADTPKKYLLYLPEGELHELTLLFSWYLLKNRKNNVIYLGQNTPFEDVKSVYDVRKPDYILTVLTSALPNLKVQSYIDKLGSTFPLATLLVTGRQVIGQDIKTSHNTHVLNKLEDLLDFAS